MQTISYNITPTVKPSFTSVKLNLNTVKETLCNEYFEKQISPFENPLFYSYLSKNSKKIDSILTKIYRKKLPQYDKILSEHNIDKKHRVLLADPEVAAHLDELGEYVTTKKIDTKNLTPFNLRKNFSDYLGTETVYRGLYSTDCNDLAQTIKKDGIYPKIANSKSNILNTLNYYLSSGGEPALNVFSRIRDMVRGKTNTEFMSVSSIYDVSASVAKNGTNKAATPVLVTEVNVPKLSVIKPKEPFLLRKSIDKDVLIIGDKKYDYETQGEQIEAFIPFHISTKNAKLKIDTTTPDYRWG